MFVSAAENAIHEVNDRRTAMDKLLPFGITFLDEALLGIMPNDLVLIGAPSGVGKTQLCCTIALANMVAGRKVHYIALEAEEFEIERRLKFQIVAEIFFNEKDRPMLNRPLTYDTWRLGIHLDALEEIEERATEYFSQAYKDLYLYYKQDKFGLPDLIEQVVANARDTDLIIVDHVHYFDFDDDNENRAMRDIAKTARTLALEEGKPIILVSHLRKRDRYNQELVAGLDEFHGSSDLYKIATKVITIAPGSPTQGGGFETFVRIPKNRINGSVTRYLGRLIFSPQKQAYESQYKIGLAGLTRTTGFEELDHASQPSWARSARGVGGLRDVMATK